MTRAKVSALPRAPRISSRRAEHRARDHEAVWAGPGTWARQLLLGPGQDCPAHYSAPSQAGILAATPVTGWSGRCENNECLNCLMTHRNSSILHFHPWFMLSQVHDIYQTNPAFKRRICLGILCFNSVNQ